MHMRQQSGLTLQINICAMILEKQLTKPVFTDVMEFEKFGRGKNLRVAKVTIDKLPSLMIPQANAYVVNPMGFNLVLNKEQIEKIAGISK